MRRIGDFDQHDTKTRVHCPRPHLVLYPRPNPGVIITAICKDYSLHFSMIYE